MKKLKKYVVNILVAIVMILSVFVLTGVTINANAQVGNNGYFTEEDYTNDDRLLLSDGMPSIKTIQKFAAEVRSASVGTAFPELSQVLPRQYLESSETNAVFQYNGKEYGFYVAKEGERFEVLLIDFVYEFEDDRPHSDLEYKIRIKPILQQTFLRMEDDNGNYTWTKSGESNYKTNGAA